MRKELLLACSLLTPLPIFGYAVTVKAPQLTVISERHVRAACNGAVETACTTFEGADLYCVCAMKGERWAASVRITAQPHMYLSHSMYRLHELSHIVDFENAMRHHAKEIETQSFESRDGCEEFLAKTRVAFPAVLREYVRESTALRDRRYPGR
ncbi:MAG TPA: hypothetical protein VGS96_12130 [Thermoanaerobaculia bacterium]|jgi:hypothetical protein|nr:hypothetical protein [Thermoanaerobaculia bacterium]